jgi:3-phenylpropionate/trans-cinnamate dioxygenase ferredoxin subunit
MPSEKKYTWHKIADHRSALVLNAQGMAQCEVGGKKICISNYKESLFGCAVKCPHAGGNMSAGYVDALGNVVCPLHRYKFSLQNGRNTSGEGYFLKTYPIEERADGVYLGMEDNNPFSFFK